MGWLTLIQGIIHLASAITDYARNRQLISLGEAKTLNIALGESLASVERAIEARRSVKHDPDSILHDPRNRD